MQGLLFLRLFLFSMNIISVTHASDIDGLGSAALIKMKYGIQSGNIFFTDYSNKGVLYVEKAIRKKLKEGVSVLFLTDLGMNDSLERIYRRIITDVKRSGGKVVWFDHHVWSSEQIRNVASLCDVAIVGENERYCATEITYRNLKMAGRRFTDDFVKLVHYSDFNITPKDPGMRRRIGVYAMSIMSYNTLGVGERRDRALRHVVDVISEGRLGDARIDGDAKRFDMLNKKRTEAMLGSLYKAGHDTVIGFSESIQSTFAGGAIMDKTGCDLAMYVNVSKGTVHLRSRETDTTVLSSSMGGGGHPHASGFPIKMEMFNNFRKESDRRKFVGFIERKMDGLYG